MRLGRRSYEKGKSKDPPFKNEGWGTRKTV